MSELFKVLEEGKRRQKTFTVTIEGTEVSVTKDQKLEIIRNGLQNYTLIDGKLQRKTIDKVKKYRFAEIENLSSDPFWPTEVHKWIR
jgi:hypothetical protein